MTRKEFDEILNAYCDTTAHLYNCVGYSNSQVCCLEKKEVRGLLWRLVSGETENLLYNLRTLPSVPNILVRSSEGELGV